MPCIAIGHHTYLNLNWGLHRITNSFQLQKHGISEMSACVKITSGLFCAHSSMFLHKDSGARPCLCSGDRSAFMSDITLHRPGQAGVREGAEGPCLLTEPWGRALAGGRVAVSCWTDCSVSPLLGFAVIRADLRGVECLHDLKPGQSSWRGCML